jgi:redox-sensitive bicupin YhaK (pirin superfamily)
MSLRPINHISKSKAASDGAGVPLYRVFGNGNTNLTDPFLMLDDLVGDPRDPAVAAGFPWHPHRGIETVTYIISGAIQHEDSLGNKGIISSGGVQWMTAGSGIIHQEMPQDIGIRNNHGFQLWANLPSSRKMTSPHYQDIEGGDIPDITEDDGTRARIITGEFWGKSGPVTGIAANPRFLDITVPPGKDRVIKIDLEHNAFAYVFEGKGEFIGASRPLSTPTEYVSSKGSSDPIASHPVENRNLILFDRGDEIRVRTGNESIRFLLVSGRPLKEPVAWYGPIVMNTQEELVQAFKEYEEGTFLKK